MLKAIFFDLDDTLFPESAWRSSGFDAVAVDVELRCGVDFHTLREALTTFDAGPDRTNVFGQLIAEFGLEVTVPELVDVFRSHRPASLEMFPEAGRFLADCPVPTAVITDGHWESQTRKIEALDVRRLVDAVVVTDLLGRDRSCWKPSSVPFDIAVRATMVEAREAVYVADNPSKDFIGPNRMGMRSIHLDQPGAVYAEADGPDHGAPTHRVSNWADLVARLGTMLEENS